MTDRAMTEEAVLASLRDIHLPAGAAGGWGADLAATLALAIACGLLLGVVLRGLSQRAKTEQEPSLRRDMAGLRDLPEPEQRVALLHLLKRYMPERYTALKPALYRPNSGLSAQELHEELSRHA